MGKSVHRIVGLHDQFGPEILIGNAQQPTVEVLAPTAFCNPVVKMIGLVADAKTTPINNPIAHLVCYAITKPSLSGPPFLASPTSVTINNQFSSFWQGGYGLVEIFQADTLCVPSYKLGWSVIPPPRIVITTE